MALSLILLYDNFIKIRCQKYDIANLQFKLMILKKLKFFYYDIFVTVVLIYKNNTTVMAFLLRSFHYNPFYNMEENTV